MSTQKKTARDLAVAVHEIDAPRFDSYYRDQDDYSRNAFLFGRKTMERVFMKNVGFLKPGARILDVGCGVGEQALNLHSLGYEVHGVDPADAMIALARTRLPSERISKGSILELPYESNSFDMVYSFEVFRYLDIADNERGLLEMQRVLRPGGVFFSSFINRFALDGFFLFEKARKLIGRSRCHHQFETPGSLLARFDQLDFVQTEVHGSMLAPLRLVYKINRRLGSKVARSLEGLDWLTDLGPTRALAGHLLVQSRKKLG
ncbi:class I SAM-dependent methyltransferase [bacterium]|nr:class I SAM-dependent methyltransferase [bacterium]